MIFKNNLIPKNTEEYNKLYKQSVDNPEVFWNDVAESFIWKKKWSNIVDFDFSGEITQVELVLATINTDTTEVIL